MSRGVILVIALLAIVFPLKSQAHFELDHDKVIVGVFDSAPYNYKGPGTFHEKLVDIFDKADLDAEIRFVPFKRGMNSTIAGQIDVMAIAVKNEERQKSLHFIEPAILQLPFHFIKRSDDPFTWNGDVEELVGKKLGYYRGAFITDELKQMEEDGRVERLDVNEIEQMLMLLQTGRIDFAVTSIFTFNTGVEKLKIEDKVEAMMPPVKVIDLHIVVSKKTPHASEIAEKIKNAQIAVGSNFNW